MPANCAAPSRNDYPLLCTKPSPPVWPGIATERIGAKRPAKEILDQIALTRRGTNAPGHIHWSMKALQQNRGGVAELLRAGPYAEKVPP